MIILIFIGLQCLIDGNCNFDFESVPQGFVVISGVCIIGFAILDFSVGMLTCGGASNEDGDAEEPAEDGAE